MDRPLGPRQPDKRYAAYESIFGRPGATHHQVNQSMPQPSFPIQQQLPQHPLYQYQYSPDRRTSFGSSYAPSTYSHASYGPSHHRHNPYNHHSQHVSPQSLYPPASIHSRARSIASSNKSPGIIMPQPPEPPDRTLEPFTRQGLTPAQAYQAQFYQNDTPGSTYTSSPALAEISYHHPSGDAAVPRQDAPVLSLTLEQDDNRLGIDFTTTNGAGSDQGTDDGSSELPWARKDDSGKSSFLFLNAATNRATYSFHDGRIPATTLEGRECCLSFFYYLHPQINEINVISRLILYMWTQLRCAIPPQATHQLRRPWRTILTHMLTQIPLFYLESHRIPRERFLGSQSLGDSVPCRIVPCPCPLH